MISHFIIYSEITIYYTCIEDRQQCTNNSAVPKTLGSKTELF